MKSQHVSISLTRAELRALARVAHLGLGDIEGDGTYSSRVGTAADRAYRKLLQVAARHEIEIHK